MAKKKSVDQEKVPASVPKVHEPGAGISKETARLLDLALHQMESGDPDGDIKWDPTGETVNNLHPAEIGHSSHSLHKGGSSNEQILFATLVEREKNADPDSELAEAYDRAVDKFDAMLEESGDEDE